MAVNDDDERRGAFGTARALLGKVVGRVVDAALGTSRPPPPTESAAPTRDMTTVEPAASAAAMPRAVHEGEGPVVAEALGDDRVRLSWALSAASLERARRVLGVDGELRARLIVVSADDVEVVRADVREHTIAESRGEWLVTNVPAGARCAAAVGVARGTRFVSAGHARVLTV